jgi:hypothetical protein
VHHGTSSCIICMCILILCARGHLQIFEGNLHPSLCMAGFILERIFVGSRRLGMLKI